MSAIAPRGPTRGPGVRAPGGALRVCWLVSRRACEGVLGAGGARGHQEACLEFVVFPGRSAEVRVALRCGRRLRIVDAARLLGCADGPAPVVERVADGDLEHWRVAVGGVGVLEATSRRGRVTYARTPVLAALGLTGGQYELQGAGGGVGDATWSSRPRAPGVSRRSRPAGRGAARV